MSKWEQYKIEENNQPVTSKWAKYRVAPIAQEEVLDEGGDSWPSFLPKAGLKAVTNIADIPSAVENLAAASMDYSPVNLLSKYFGGPSIKHKPILPTTSDARAKIKEYTGVDLEPKPSSPAQRIIGNVLDFAVPGGMFGKVAKAPTTLGKIWNTAKPTVGAGAVGAGSGALQEMGVNPLVADIGTSLTPYGAKKAMQGVTKPLSYLLPTAEEVASRSLQRQVGKENIPQVLEKLDKKLPFNAPATTAELADNVGIAKMHQAMSPNTPAIYQKQAMADDILRGEINKLSTMNDFTPYNLGEIIRDRLDNKLQNAKAVRSQNADTLGKGIDSLTQPVSAENTINFLKERNKFAKGLVKKEINYVKSLLKNNNSDSKKNASLIKDINDKLIEYKDSPAVVAALKAERDKLQQKLLPGDLRGAEKAINKKLRKPQEVDDLEVLIEAKNQIKSDLEKSGIPEVAEFNKTYARDSKPVSAIETNSLLSKFTDKKNRKNQFSEKEISDFVLSPERIPEKILASSIDETKALMKQVNKDPQMLNAVRSSFVNDLLNRSRLSASNVSGNPKLSYDKFSKFLTQHRGKLPEVFDKNQIEVLNNAKDLLKARNKAETMGRAIGSNTQSETTLLAELTNDSMTKLGKQAAKILPFGKRISPIVSNAYNSVLKVRKQSIHEILKEALADPEKAKLLLTPTKDIKSLDQLNTILARLTPISNTSIEDLKRQYPDAVTIDNMGGE